MPRETRNRALALIREQIACKKQDLDTCSLILATLQATEQALVVAYMRKPARAAKDRTAARAKVKEVWDKGVEQGRKAVEEPRPIVASDNGD